MTTARRRAREKSLRRKAILASAREVFFGQGISKGTVDDVAVHAEVSKGTIYLYFSSKEALLAHLLLEGLTILGGDLRHACERCSDEPAPEQVRGLAQAYLDFYRQHPNYFRLIMAFDRGRFQEQIPPELAESILSRSTGGLEVVSAVIQRGVDQGTFETSDPWLSAGIFWAGLNGVLVLFASSLRQQMLKMDLESMFQATCELLLKGLARADRG